MGCTLLRIDLIEKSQPDFAKSGTDSFFPVHVKDGILFVDENLADSQTKSFVHKKELFILKNYRIYSNFQCQIIVGRSSF